MDIAIGQFCLGMSPCVRRNNIAFELNGDILT